MREERIKPQGHHSKGTTKKEKRVWEEREVRHEGRGPPRIIQVNTNNAYTRTRRLGKCRSSANRIGGIQPGRGEEEAESERFCARAPPPPNAGPLSHTRTQQR